MGVRCMLAFSVPRVSLIFWSNARLIARLGVLKINLDSSGVAVARLHPDKIVAFWPKILCRVVLQLPLLSCHPLFPGLNCVLLI